MSFDTNHMANSGRKRSLSPHRKAADPLTRPVQCLISESAGELLRKKAGESGLKEATYVRLIIYRELGIIQPEED